MNIKYRTKDGLADYEFSFEKVGEGYRAYIVKMPSYGSYGSRDTSLSVTHRLMSGDRYYVCWDQPLHTLESLKQVVALWSDLTQAYIRTGRTINDQMAGRQRSDQISRGTFHTVKKESNLSEWFPQQLFMTMDVYDQIREEIGKRNPEQGGPLGGSRENFVVEHFYFDKSAQRTGATYSPNYQYLNDMFRKKWNPVGINLLGFVHSHPSGFWSPSSGDLFYAEEILRGIPELSCLLLPIVKTERSGEFKIFPYAAVKSPEGIQIVPLTLEVIPNDPRRWPPIPASSPGRFITEDEDERASSIVSSSSSGEVLSKDPSNVAKTPVQAQVSKSSGPVDLSDTFSRVQSAYDLQRMARTRLICVGVGGAASFIEDLARAGIGEYVLIDPDKVSESNLATQQVYRKDIGRFKVDCLAERIQDINPNAIVRAYPSRLDDLADSDFAQLIEAPLANGDAPDLTLLCGLTDNFDAQARINRLALHFGLPSLCAQVYEEGRGAEVTFTFPGITPACHRCILSSRYEHYLKKGLPNPVTSDGTPISATTRLNALKFFVALALIHHGTTHPRWGGLLERIGKRNLVQIRMDPDMAKHLPIQTFDRVFGGAEQGSILFDETIWRTQEPEGIETGSLPCPDCGGTGDLREVQGTFKDTRILRK